MSRRSGIRLLVCLLPLFSSACLTPIVDRRAEEDEALREDDRAASRALALDSGALDPGAIEGRPAWPTPPGF
jgi:hypothetical protein